MDWFVSSLVGLEFDMVIFHICWSTAIFAYSPAGLQTVCIHIQYIVHWSIVSPGNANQNKRVYHGGPRRGTDLLVCTTIWFLCCRMEWSGWMIVLQTAVVSLGRSNSNHSVKRRKSSQILWIITGIFLSTHLSSIKK